MHLACYYDKVRDLPLSACAIHSASNLPTRTPAPAARFLCYLHAADRAALYFCVRALWIVPPSRDVLNDR